MPDSDALVYGDTSLTWRELDMRADKLAAVCLKQGICAGKHVAIWAENGPSWVILFYALARIGAVSVLLNTCSSAEELTATLKAMDIQFLLYGDSSRDVVFEPVVEGLDRGALPVLQACLPLGKTLEEATVAAPLALDEVARAEEKVQSGDVASILLTSGTTGGAKGVVLTHANLLGNAQAIVDRLGWSSEDCMCTAVPLFHCFGVTISVLGSACSGARMVLVPGGFRSETVLQTIEEHRCTIFNGVPTMFLVLLRSPKLETFDLSSLRGGIVAGSWLSRKDYMRICDVMGLDRLYTSYGLTESSPCVTLTCAEDPVEVRSRTAGEPLPEVELRIWDVEKNQLAPVGAVGEIQTRSAYVMKEYYGRPKATAFVVTEEGWLRTGDKGYVDQDGRLHVTGRIKEMILRGGECISPWEIECCLKELPGVETVKVLGVAAEVVQEEIAACIVRKPGAELSEEDVRRWAEQHMSRFKIPKHILFFDTLPMGASGKIQIQELKKQVLSRVRI